MGLMSTERENALLARALTLEFEMGLIMDLARSLGPGARMAKKKAPDQEPPKINLARAIFHTIPPEPGDPREHFAMCWSDRQVETLAAEFNGEPAPVYAALPKRVGER